MQSEKVKIISRVDDKNCLIYSAIVRRNGSGISSVQFNPQNGEQVQKGQNLGKVICSDGSEKEIKFMFSGKIDNINTKIDLNAPSFSLCHIIECDHDQLEQTDLKHMHICLNCKEQVWVYRDKNAGVIVAKNLSDFISNKRVDLRDDQFDIKFSTIKLNEIIQPKVVLFEVEQTGNNSDSDSDGDEEKIEFSLNEIIYIKDINFNYQKDKSWILKYEKVICSHQVIDTAKTCTFCSVYLPDHQNQKYAGLDQKENKLHVGKEYAEYSKKLAHQELHSNQRLILVLDLDNTILHAVAASTNVKYDNCEGIQKDSFHEFSNRYNKYVIKIRPFMKEFLQTILPHYEIYIFTMAVLDYAKSICDYLKEQYKDILQEYPKTFGKDRIISRESFTSNNKDLAQILPNSDKVMLILDDRSDVWSKNEKNLVVTLPYIYWSDGGDSWNEQVFKSTEQIQQNKYRFFYKNSKTIIPTVQSNTQATSFNMYSSNDDTNQQVDQSQSSSDEKQVDSTKSQIKSDENQNKEIQQNEEKIEVEQSLSKDDKEEQQKIDAEVDDDIKQLNIMIVRSQDVSHTQYFSELSGEDDGNKNSIDEEEIDNQQSLQKSEETNSNGESKDQTTQINEEIQKDQKQNNDIINKQQPKSNEENNKIQSNLENSSVLPPIIMLQESQFRPNYKQNILKQFDNEKFYKSNSTLQYKLQVIKIPDNYLLFTAPILVHLKNSYYCQQQEQDRDIREVYSQYKQSILKGVKIGVSQIAKKNDTLETNIICKRFRALGGVIVDKFEKEGDIDYLVIGSNRTKEKLKKASDNNIPILNYKWIEYCWFYNYKLDFSIFEVSKEDFILKKSNQQIEQDLFNKYPDLIKI